MSEGDNHVKKRSPVPLGGGIEVALQARLDEAGLTLDHADGAGDAFNLATYSAARDRCSRIMGGCTAQQSVPAAKTRADHGKEPS